MADTAKAREVAMYEEQQQQVDRERRDDMNAQLPSYDDSMAATGFTTIEATEPANPALQSYPEKTGPPPGMATMYQPGGVPVVMYTTPNTSGFPGQNPHGVVITQPVPQNGLVGVENRPRNYFWMSILVTIFCNLCCGIIGVVHSRKSTKIWAQGHVKEAMKKAKMALGFNIAGIVLGALMWIAVVAVLVKRSSDGEDWIND